jgi:hypothetical protein
MFLYFQALNNLKITKKFLILVIGDLLDELHRDNFVTKLDICSSYYKIRINMEDIPNIHFHTCEGHYGFLVMPFEV